MNKFNVNELVRFKKDDGCVESGNEATIVKIRGDKQYVVFSEVTGEEYWVKESELEGV